MEPEQIKIECHVDDRGFLYQIYGNYLNKFPPVRRVYVVGNFSKGIIRGFHKHLEEWKCYFAISGSAKFVVINEGKKILTYVLCSRSPSILIVPPTYAHGWISLEDNTVLIGFSNKTLEESLRDDVRIDPFTFGRDVWEVKPR